MIRVLLDTDANNEIDDQHAIAYLLLSGEAFTVEGLTVNRTDNGGDIEAQALEAQRIVELCTLQRELPVTRGASANYTDIEPSLTEADFDGADAVELIIQRAHARLAGKLVLVAIGKLTNVALALTKDPSIASKIKVLWLGSNYPAPGEYNLENDMDAVNAVLESPVEFEMAVVRYGADSGTSAVRVTPQELLQHIGGKGPQADPPVTGRNGGCFTCFGDYAINLLEHIELSGNPPSRALYDMAALAVVKNPSWADAQTIPAPRLEQGQWHLRPDNPRTIVIRENFQRQAILSDFYASIENYRLATISR